jgi:hypothetical protein
MFRVKFYKSGLLMGNMGFVDSLSEVLVFRNVGFVIFLIALLAFILIYVSLVRLMGNKSTALIVAFSASMIGGYYLYRSGFNNSDKLLIILFILIVFALVLKLFGAFGRWGKANFGRY